MSESQSSQSPDELLHTQAADSQSDLESPQSLGDDPLVQGQNPQSQVEGLHSGFKSSPSPVEDPGPLLEDSQSELTSSQSPVEDLQNQVAAPQSPAERLQSEHDSEDARVEIILSSALFPEEEHNVLVDVHSKAYSRRKLLDHKKKEKKQFDVWKKKCLSDGVPPATESADESTGSKLWKPVNITSYLDGTPSTCFIIPTRGAESELADPAAEIPTAVLHRFSQLIATQASANDNITVFAYGFSKLVIRQLVSFLKGELEDFPAWLDDQRAEARIDLEMLGFHLEIAALQTAALESLHRELIGYGRWANWDMLIHIWTVSDSEDPLRRLVLSAFYLNVVICRGQMRISDGKLWLLPCDYDKGMRLSDLREMVESHSMVDAVSRPIEEQQFRPWHSYMTKHNRFNSIVDSIRKLRPDLLRDGAIFQFPDDSASLKQRLVALDKECYIIADLTKPIEIPSSLENKEDTSSAAARSPSKRKLDDDATASPRPAKFACQQLESNLPSKYNFDQSTRLELRGGNVHINLAWLVDVSITAYNRFIKHPTLKKFKFHDIELLDYLAFADVAVALSKKELGPKARPFSDVRAGLGVVAAAERFQNSWYEAQLLGFLKPMFKKTTMNFAIVKWVDQNTARESSSSGLRDFVAECLHWVLRKNGHGSGVLGLFDRHAMPMWALDKVEQMCLEFGEEEKEEKEDEKREKKHPCAEMAWNVPNRDFQGKLE